MTADEQKPVTAPVFSGETFAAALARAGTEQQQVARSPIVPDLDLDLLASFLDRPTLTRAVNDFRAAAANRGQ